MRQETLKATPAEVEKVAGKVPVVLRQWRAKDGSLHPHAWSDLNSVPAVVLVQPRARGTIRRPCGNGLEAVKRATKAARRQCGDTIEIAWCAGTLW